MLGSMIRIFFLWICTQYYLSLSFKSPNPDLQPPSPAEMIKDAPNCEEGILGIQKSQNDLIHNYICMYVYSITYCHNQTKPNSNFLEENMLKIHQNVEIQETTEIYEWGNKFGLVDYQISLAHCFNNSKIYCRYQSATANFHFYDSPNTYCWTLCSVFSCLLLDPAYPLFNSSLKFSCFPSQTVYIRAKSRHKRWGDIRFR